MMCQRIGRPPTSTIGLGRNSVSSRRRVPCPPQRMMAFMRGSGPKSSKREKTGAEENLIATASHALESIDYIRLRDRDQQTASNPQPGPDSLEIGAIALR